jgi:hypothetical protein
MNARKFILAGFAALSLLSSIGAALAQPAPVPALPDAERRTAYSISGTTCGCSIGFALFGDSNDYQNWVEVFINGVRVNYNDATFGWTITSPSGSLATLPRPISNAVLTFNSAQTGTVQIVGARRPRRTSQFNENTGIPARNHNQVLTDITATLREMWDKSNDMTGRGLFSQPGVTLGLLPLPSACAGKFLSFDVTGLIPQCLSGAGSGNVVGPVSSVVGNIPIWANSTGSLLGSAPGNLQTYPTLASAAAATIPATVNVVSTLGRTTAGDNGGASYIRISPSTVAAWRFQSADGQWWALLNQTVTPEMFGCFSGQDCTAVFGQLATWLSTINPLGITINNQHGADYQIWPAGTTPAPLMDLTAVKGLTWNFNGSQISTNNLFAPVGSPYVFLLHSIEDITFNGPKYTQTAFTTVDPNKGGLFIFVLDNAAPYSNGIIINDIKQTGGVMAFGVAPATLSVISTRNIKINNADLNNLYYGLSFQKGGDGVVAKGINCNNCGRAYFPYGVANHDIEIIHNGGHTFNSVLLKVYADPAAPPQRNMLSDIKLVYRNPGRLANVTAQSQVALSLQQVVPQVNVSGAANNGAGKVRLTVNTTADMLTGQTWFFNSIGGTTEANGVRTVTVIDATHVDLATVTFVNAYTAGGYARVPAEVKNIDITLDIADNGNQQPAALLTNSANSDGAASTVASGYSIENFFIGGKLKGYDYGINAIDMFTNTGGFAGSFGSWVGETIRNVGFRDLIITGTSSAVLIDATAVSANLILENVVSPAGVPWTVTDPNTVVRALNVSATGATDRRSVAPSLAVANQFMTGITADGTITRAQPAAANLSDGNTGTGAVVHATSPAITTPTGIVKGDVGLGNVDNTSDATKNAAAVTLANKTLTAPIISKGVFSGLATCAAGNEGTVAAVTDNSTITWRATITGGGANHVLAYCNGTNWTVAG